MLTLSSAQRRFLRARAHVLQPVVMIGNQGLTEAVLKEISSSLAHHELIKIRVLGDDRAARIAYYATICGTLSAAEVQHIGKLLIIYRPAEKRVIILPKN